jgi:hypothetical protein
MELSMKTKTNVYVPFPRISLNSLWLFIAGILARVNRGYDDYELRGIMGEWTRDEARAEIQAGIDVQEDERLKGEFWTSGW